MYTIYNNIKLVLLQPLLGKSTTTGDFTYNGGIDERTIERLEKEKKPKRLAWCVDH